MLYTEKVTRHSPMKWYKVKASESIATAMTAVTPGPIFDVMLNSVGDNLAIAAATK
ncbi:hypothetical protein JCM19235_6078 [Vibrio maritimus]|uniref:Uncharacterized protein n=1 Tax=Vibrio maritimus TaxID=990268 RepID=A0A090RQ68_9VIBR|nr:hypothetical protein JCM19235_6078 [Vibrio maritimus]